MTYEQQATTAAPQRITLAGCPIDLMTENEAVDIVLRAAQEPDPVPLAVASANLDHLYHFGVGGRWHGVLEHAEAVGRVRWCSLLDGIPLVRRAEHLTGRAWPRLAGSDLMDPLLAAATASQLRVGFLGGSKQNQALLQDSLERDRPGLRLAGLWAPPRAVLTDQGSSRELAEEIRRSRVDVLVVGLGKPRQELWIAEHGHLTEAPVLLAFGAVVDLLAGRVRRPPAWLATHGFEWSYRLAHEPRRLSRRYLLDGPVAYRRLHHPSAAPREAARSDTRPRFVSADDPADITAVIVAHNSAASIGHLISELRREATGLRLRVVVVDNDSRDDTVERVRRHTDVLLERCANLGYAGGINRGLRATGDSHAVLLLNPDLRIEDGAVSALWHRLREPGVGTAVPMLLDATGRRTGSLRFEPTVLRTLGDAFLGDRFPGRPVWLTETDHDEESYAHAHPIEWATGACVMLRSEVIAEVGAWDERYFLYSEEVDYLRRVRCAGWTNWYEPAARVRHVGGGSGSSPQLAALLAVNRVRYAERHQRPTSAVGIRGAVLLGHMLRASRPESRVAARHLISRRSWISLPASASPSGESDRPRDAAEPTGTVGSIVVPAHDEETVIERTLSPLAGLLDSGRVELVVAANGCQDRTVELARRCPGAEVLDIAEASKPKALNAADGVASRWPRLYLDADVEITPRAVTDVFAVLDDGLALAARPPVRYRTDGASWLVRAFYRARQRLPETAAHLWGGGAYGLSAAGHARFREFPDRTADDLFVDSLFRPDERAIVDTDPVIVHTPRRTDALLAVLRRTYAGNRELRRGPVGANPEPTTYRVLRELLRSARSPGSAVDAIVYSWFVLAARGVSGARPRWERDESSRSPLT